MRASPCSAANHRSANAAHHDKPMTKCFVHSIAHAPLYGLFRRALINPAGASVRSLPDSTQQSGFVNSGSGADSAAWQPTDQRRECANTSLPDTLRTTDRLCLLDCAISTQNSPLQVSLPGTLGISELFCGLLRSGA